MSKTILYALGVEKAKQAENPRFQLLAPYSTYIKEKKRSFKNEKKNPENWTYMDTLFAQTSNGSCLSDQQKMDLENY